MTIDWYVTARNEAVSVIGLGEALGLGTRNDNGNRTLVKNIADLR